MRRSFRPPSAVPCLWCREFYRFPTAILPGERSNSRRRKRNTADGHQILAVVMGEEDSGGLLALGEIRADGRLFPRVEVLAQEVELPVRALERGLAEEEM
jgi:hypothetical protein